MGELLLSVFGPLMFGRFLFVLKICFRIPLKQRSVLIDTNVHLTPKQGVSQPFHGLWTPSYCLYIFAELPFTI